MSQPKTKKVVTSKPAAGADDLAVSAGAQRAFERFLPAAESLAARDLVPMRADPRVALQNAQTASATLLGVKSVLQKELPKLSLDEVARLPELALAVIFASAQVDRGAGASTGAIGKQLARATVLRRLLLSTATSLSLAGLIPPRAVAKIREGRGAIDAAQDCIDSAALFRKYPEAAKKSAVTAAQIREAAELGTALLSVLQPRHAKAKTRTPDAVTRAAELRDRFWTLLVTSHDRAWRAGVWLYGRNSEDRVPSLLAHRAAKKAVAKPATGDAPAE